MKLYVVGLCLWLSLWCRISTAQNLTNGDLAVVSFQTAPNGMLGLVALTNLPGSATVYMTVASWSNGFDSSAAYQWTLPPGGITAGTFITVTNFNSAALAVSAGSISTGTLQMALSSDGDQILLFQTNSLGRWFIYAMNYNVPWITNGPYGPTLSYEPPGVVGASMALLSVTNGAYNRVITNGTKAQVLAAITNEVNWIRSSSTFSYTNLPMTVTNPYLAQITFATSSAPARLESAGVVQVRVNLSAAVSRTAQVTSVGTAFIGSDFTLSSTQLVFNGSGTSQTFNVTLLDDGIAESNEVVSLLLVPGAETEASPQPVFQMTVLDDEATVQFATNAGESAEGDAAFSISVIRNDSVGTTAVQVVFAGDAVLGEDFEATAISRIRNPSRGSPTMGSSLASWGTNLFAVGAEQWGLGGAVIFYDGMGQQMAVVSNPSPDEYGIDAEEQFAGALVFVNSNLLAVGSEGDNSVSNDAGAVHLFSWNGTQAGYVGSIYDPNPSTPDRFGVALARLDTNLFLVGAMDSDLVVSDSGSVYLYRWNGTSAVLLASIPNPTPLGGDVFGRSIAVLATNKFAVGDEYDDAGAIVNAGTAFLYEWNGISVSAPIVVTNPAPGTTDQFGHALEGMSSNRLLITADRDTVTAALTNAGRAFLYDWSSTGVVLVTTITNPAPAVGDNFGNAISAVSTSRFVVGTAFDDAAGTNAGAAYLYDLAGTNAVLATTLLSPTAEAEDYAGRAVLGVSGTKLLVGADLDNEGVTDSGAVRLYEWNGVSAALLSTFTNQAPADRDTFGIAAADLGNNDFVIGASDDHGGADYGGAAHVFRWDGLSVKWMTTVTNPVSSDYGRFGEALAGMGSDRFVVGAPNEGTDAIQSGRAFLFGWNGTNANLLATLTNPSPATLDYFGQSVSGLGTNRFLVSAYNDDMGAANAGSVYIYDWDGVAVSLLTTVTNSAPVADDQFGRSVSSMGAFRFVVGAPGDDLGAANAGGAYVYQWFASTLTLLAVVTNPAPESGDEFGATVKGINATRFLVGAPSDSPGVFPQGSAYLYDYTGSGTVLLATFSNPTPQSADFFGSTLAAAGGGRFLVGAYQDQVGGEAPGSAYVFDWDGSVVRLIDTIASPSTSASPFEGFGTSIAVIDSLGVIIGAPSDDDLGSYSGSAWLYRTAKTGETFTVVFEPGQTSSAIRVNILDDTLLEWSESFALSLAIGVGVQPFSVTSTVYIIYDNDPWAEAGPIRPSTPGFVTITWTDTVVGTSYILESSTNLAASLWSTTAVFNATGVAHTVPFAFPTNGAEAFRLRW